MDFVLITPVKNEEKFIRQTIESVIKQTQIPLEWVIIDGGSTDKTRIIIKEYSSKYPWIKLISQLQFSDNGGHTNVSIAMKEAYEYICALGIPFDYVWNLDADQTIQSDLFEGITNLCKENQKIGVASGQVYDPNGKPDTYPDGELPNKRIYNRKAIDGIGGYPVTKYSFDTVILAKIRMAGWEIKSFPEYKIHNLRSDMGIEHTSLIKSNLQFGKSRYYLGYSVPLVILGCGYLILKGKVGKSIGIFFGYCSSWINHDDIIQDKEIWNHFHYERIKEVLKP